MGATVRIGDLEVSALWLRDSCICNECRHADSGQRLRSVLALDPSTSATSVSVDGDSVRVRFAPDDHVAAFSLQWLRANAPGRATLFDDRSARSRTPWRAADMPDGPPTVSWSEL